MKAFILKQMYKQCLTNDKTCKEFITKAEEKKSFPYPPSLLLSLPVLSFRIPVFFFRLFPVPARLPFAVSFPTSPFPSLSPPASLCSLRPLAPFPPPAFSCLLPRSPLLSAPASRAPRSLHPPLSSVRARPCFSYLVDWVPE